MAGPPLPTAALKAASAIAAAEAWPSSFSHHLLCKEGSREGPWLLPHLLKSPVEAGRDGGSRKEADLAVPMNGPCGHPTYSGTK